MIGNSFQNKKKLSTTKGFTLIEVIVSVALFSVIMLITTNIFSMVIRTQRNSIATQNVQESLKYFLEVIGKEIRMAQKDPTNICGVPSGQIFVITTDSNGNNTLHFKNYYGQCVTYSLASDPHNSQIQRFQIQRNSNKDFISPERITIDHLYFKLNKSSEHPMVTIDLTAHSVLYPKLDSTMTIQTSLSSRYYK